MQKLIRAIITLKFSRLSEEQFKLLVELSNKFQPVSQLQYQFFLDTTILFQRDFIYIK